MIVVSNSSPLIALSLVNQLELLPALYSQIQIARAVRSEIVTKGKRRGGAANLSKVRWLVTTPISRRALAALQPQPSGLHAGEIETLALALQLRADVILMDERLARNFAASKGLKVLGTLGILQDAYRKKLLPDLRGALNDLRAKGFRFTDELYEQILAE